MSAFVAYIFVAFWTAIISLLFLASFNASLGIRRKYVEMLLTIFEFGKIKIEKAEKRSKLLPQVTGIIDKKILMGPLPSQLMVSGFDCNWSYNNLKREFELWDAANFIKSGVEAIIEDGVTKRFSAEELPSWNLLTRTNKNYAFVSVRLSILWGFGWILRYCILLPIRLLITVIALIWLLLCTSIIGYLPEGRFKRWLYSSASLVCFRILARSFSAIVTYHNKEYRAKGGGICVANHTSPIDVVILACDNCYALVGQKQGGFLGVIQRALNRAASHVWFERFEMKDRASVTKRLREHCEDPEKLPILIFPEGTCINNTSVMMFKKGSFEVGGVIYPAAIKEGESSIDFAKRVKAVIAKRGGLVDLEWDGQLKRLQVKKEWKEMQQQEFSKKLIQN